MSVYTFVSASASGYTYWPRCWLIYYQIHAIFTVSFGSFFRYISLRIRKMCILEKLNFKISRGSMPPDPPTVLVPSALDTIFAGLTLNCFRRACYYQWVIHSIILRILPTRKNVSLVSRKRVHLPYYTEIYILRTADMRSAQA